MLNNVLKILRQISEVIAKNRDYSMVLEQVVEILAENLQVDVCSVYVYEDKDDKLLLTATKGLNKDSVGLVSMKPEEGLTGASFKQRKILNLSNPEEHPQFMFFKNTGEEKYKSFLAVPLTVGGRCVGVLTIQRMKAERFSPAIIDMAKSLSTQLANLILNAKMLKDLALGDKAFAKIPIDEDLGRQTMFRGVAANSGIAKGRAFKFEGRDFLSIAHQTHAEPEKEISVFEAAVELTKKKTVALEERALSMISEADASIFYAHLLFLEDPSLIDEIKKEIKENNHTAEFAIKMVFLEYQKRFRHLGDQVFRDKVMDLKDVLLRLIESAKIIKGGKANLDDFDSLEGNQIIVAEELLPSDLLRIPIDNISGIVCEKGGVTAHVAILAKALNIPALMGVKKVTKKVRDNDEVILDCHAEVMYANPGEQIKLHFEEMERNGAAIEAAPDSDPAVTVDGQELTLRGNISLICETSLLKQYGAKGIGLYRTEFLFMIRDYLPSEEDQYKVFSKIMQEANGECVTIRALDTGGDKPLPYIDFAKEDNPALGFRGIRLLLARQDIFKAQIRAILRAGVFGNLKILFPMVTSPAELIAIKRVLAEVETELHEKNIEHTENYKTGIMLEVPSAVFALNSMIDDVDYMSIGSNDLLQYTFAADRGNELVSETFQALHPIFLGVLKQIGDSFKKRPEKEIALCGEMAGNILAIPFLIGAGIHDLSMPPRQIPLIKKVIRAFSVKECEDLINEAIKLNNLEAVSCLAKNALASKGLGDPI